MTTTNPPTPELPELPDHLWPSDETWEAMSGAFHAANGTPEHMRAPMTGYWKATMAAVLAVYEAGRPALLTEHELKVMDLTADLASGLARTVGYRSTRQVDMAELMSHVHVLQAAILAQAAARAYPDRFRLLGGTPPVGSQ
jgi:hypothetical protein